MLRHLSGDLVGSIPKVEAGLKVADARRLLARAFATAGLDAPELDARLLTGHALGLDHAALVTAAERPLTLAEAENITGLAARRLAHEPVARILGVKEFWGLPFRLGASLVPRPETEAVVELALAVIGPDRARPWRIADLGTGSGALLLALLTELPGAVGIGTDISLAALATARDNARRLGLLDRSAFVASDFGAALAGPFDLVVSNPPYVKSAEIAALPPEVREHDPLVSLDGGPDGLVAYRAIATQAGRLLGGGGRLVIEIGAGARADVASVFAAAGLAVTEERADLAGIPRALYVRPPR